MIIAVDGPAASGKGTIARRLATHYGLAYLDTGSLYRRVGMGMVLRGEDPADEKLAKQAALALSATELPDEQIRSEQAGAAASIVAANQAVRAALRAYQQGFVSNPPGDVKGAVIDGRDIGTVICPGADAKLFVTASLETRAERRYLELLKREGAADYTQIEADLAARDERDANRSASPLIQAEDACLLDTTKLDIEAAVAEAKALVDACLAQR
jgi:cytidylate kinase